MKWNATITFPSPLLMAGSMLFNGTGLWLTSSTAHSGLNYTVSLDSSSSFSSTVNPSNLTLFQSRDLSTSSPHSFKISPASVLASVTVEMDLANANRTIFVDDNTIWGTTNAVDAVPTITGNWTQEQCFGTTQAAQRCHSTRIPGASIALHFTGSAITLFGSMESSQSSYSVSLDGSEPTTYSGFNASTNVTTALAYFGSLAPVTHTLTIVNTPLDGKSGLGIDGYQLWDTQKSTIAPVVPYYGAPIRKLGAMTGGAIAGCFLLIFGSMFYRRYRDRMRRRAASTFTMKRDLEISWDAGVTDKVNPGSGGTVQTGHRRGSSTSSLKDPQFPEAALHIDSASVSRELPVMETSLSTSDGPWMTTPADSIQESKK
ncbi:hypothetical protein FRB99_006274 [Tulasnella sp. 403]|nr:hypothetical protein FRB99_006274 [Tulasnella sp. 403]